MSRTALAGLCSKAHSRPVRLVGTLILGRLGTLARR